MIPDKLRMLIDYGTSTGIDVVIGMDANAHHPAWGSTNINSRGDHLLEYIVSTHLDICNKGNRPTFVTQSRREVLDLTLCNLSLSSSIQHWTVDDKDHYPDHQLITFSMGGKPSPPTYRRNPRRCDWPKYWSSLQTPLQKMIPNQYRSACLLYTSPSPRDS